MVNLPILQGVNWSKFIFNIQYSGVHVRQGNSVPDGDFTLLLLLRKKVHNNVIETSALPVSIDNTYQFGNGYSLE